MDVQYVTNEKGERTAVLIPIKQWETIQNIVATETTVFEDMQEAIEEMKLIKSGKLKGVSAKDLLNEL